jgi:predicted O-methyltransferase YrrM
LAAQRVVASGLPPRVKVGVRRALKRLLADGSLPPVIDAKYALWSIVSSTRDQYPPPSERLLDLALAAAGKARSMHLSEVAERVVPAERAAVSRFPGEHYALLAALAELERPAVAVEVGTFTGMGALALRSHLPPESRVVTYDVLEWSAFADTLLRAGDFGSRFEQRLGDLSDRDYFDGEVELLRSARLIFIDGPKDGRFEPTFLEWLLPQLAGSGAIVVLDDIRVLNMVDLWRRLPVPKLDITSFGHWTGTGLLDLA